MCKIEDNPVPSLDKLFKEFLKGQAFDMVDIKTCELYNEFLKTKLENGVTTDKEQPYHKAKKILKAKKRRKICIKAKICPICGSPIQKFYKGDVTKDQTFVAYKACTNNEKHYKHAIRHYLDYDEMG